MISRPALWSGRGQVRILDGIGGPDTEGEIFEVTDTGLAAGASATSREHSDPSFAFHATRWDTNSTPHDLGTLTGDNFSQALGLAPNGYVAGLSATVDATTGEPGIGHAFIWSGDGPLHPLPLPGLDWTATSSIAHQIDDHGIVAGAYTPPGGPSRAALWTCTTPS